MKTYLVTGPNPPRLVYTDSIETALSLTVGIGHTFTESDYKIFLVESQRNTIVNRLYTVENWDAHNHDFSEIDLDKDLFYLFKRSKIITTKYHNQLTPKVVFNCILQGGNPTGEKILARIDADNITANYATYILEQYDCTEWDAFKNFIKNSETPKSK